MHSKPQNYEISKTSKYKTDPYTSENMTCDPKKDEYTCPDGRILKEDYGFKRFLTRGKKNIETHFFLLAFAFNIHKLCNRIKTGRFGRDLFPLKAV